MEQTETSNRIGTEKRMRRVALIENPASGSVSGRRKHVVKSALAALQEAGVDVEHVVLKGPGSGAALAREAVDLGCDAILVCGGDGTVHEVLQSVVATGVALGVLPLGTANALAANLGLAGSPEKAIRSLIEAARVEVPVGRITYRAQDGSEQSHYFTVAAGVGPDALVGEVLHLLVGRGRHGFSPSGPPHCRRPQLSGSRGGRALTAAWPVVKRCHKPPAWPRSGWRRC